MNLENIVSDLWSFRKLQVSLIYLMKSKKFVSHQSFNLVIKHSGAVQELEGWWGVLVLIAALEFDLVSLLSVIIFRCASIS